MPQNRLVGSWKISSKIDRLQQRRSSKHEDKHKKKSKPPHPDRKLFEVETLRKEKPPQPKDEPRLSKSHPSPNVGLSTPPKRPKIDRSKFSGQISSHSAPRSHEGHSDYEGYHSKPSSEGRSYSRESSKPRSRPPSRQGNRTSRSPGPLTHSNRSPGSSTYSPYSEDEYPIRGARQVPHDPHMRWKKDRSPERTHKHSKKREGHHRRHHDEPHISKSRTHHHHSSSREEHWPSNEVTDTRAMNGKGDSRRQSYESVSEEDDLERRYEKAWHKDRKRRRSEHLDNDNSVMQEHHHNKVAHVTHKTYKHSKDHSEKWRKTETTTGKFKAHKH